MQISALQQQCANHGERPASALCVSCKRSICQECATHWDGINYCVTCLAGRGRGVATVGRRSQWFVLAICASLFFWLAVRAMLWIGGVVASLT
jgi:hypothetical protein